MKPAHSAPSGGSVAANAATKGAAPVSISPPLPVVEAFRRRLAGAQGQGRLARGVTVNAGYLEGFGLVLAVTALPCAHFNAGFFLPHMGGGCSLLNDDGAYSFATIRDLGAEALAGFEGTAGQLVAVLLMPSATDRARAFHVAGQSEAA